MVTTTTATTTTTTTSLVPSRRSARVLLKIHIKSIRWALPLLTPTSRLEEEEKDETMEIEPFTPRRSLFLSPLLFEQFSAVDDERFIRFNFLISTSKNQQPILDLERVDGVTPTSDTSQFENVLLELLPAILFFGQFVSQID